MSTSSSIRTSTIVIASTGAIIAGFLGMSFGNILYAVPQQAWLFLCRCKSLLMFVLSTGYAVYFDHKRRSDPEFRKALKRESRREARVAKEQEEAEGAQQMEAIKAAVDEAKEEGFPTDVEDKEAFFMNEVGQGEILCQDSKLSKDTEQTVRMLRYIARHQTSGGSALLLQSPQGLPSAERPDLDL